MLGAIRIYTASANAPIPGDSIVEHWSGTEAGKGSKRWKGNFALYQQLFRSSQSYIRGLALGIGGDKCPQLLYRLQNGELSTITTTMLIPSQYWILIGTNDLLSHCSPDAVVAGILNLVHTIRQQQQQIVHDDEDDDDAPNPNQQQKQQQMTIVLHSILPRGRFPLSQSLGWSFIQDVNRRLACFAESSSSFDNSVEFFNATEFFLTHNHSHVNHTLEGDYLHPTALGSLEWGKALVRTSLQLLGKPPLGPHAFDNLSLNLSDNTTKRPPMMPTPSSSVLTPTMPKTQLPSPTDSHTDTSSSSTPSSSTPSSTPPPPSSSSSSCTDLYTNGQGWESWKRAQQQQHSNPLDWCSNRQVSRCRRCTNPFVPVTNVDKMGNNWHRAFERNVALVQEELTFQQQHQQAPQPLDMILMGDSIVEHWLGTGLGRRNSRWNGNLALYRQLFRSPHSYIRGLFLGVGGDKCPQLLYRLQNGEMPTNTTTLLAPKQWWILVGTNDLFARCTRDAIVVGILNLVETIRHVHPANETTIVLHSIFPRGKDALPENHDWSTIQEINHRLECFASSSSQSNNGVGFFNATEFLLTRTTTTTTTTDGYDHNPAPPPRINATLMGGDYLHPNGLGSLEWGKAMVRKSLQLLGKPQPGPHAFDNLTLDLSATENMTDDPEGTGGL